ncbi:hypothetical protein IAU60_006623 [Kwoniella sp. DSM 27419]
MLCAAIAAWDDERARVEGFVAERFTKVMYSHVSSDYPVVRAEMDEIAGLHNAVAPRNVEDIVTALDSLAIKLRDESLRAPLGETELPVVLTELAKSPDIQVIRQVARVTANLVVDSEPSISALRQPLHIRTLFAWARRWTESLDTSDEAASIAQWIWTVLSSVVEGDVEPAHFDTLLLALNDLSELAVVQSASTIIEGQKPLARTEELLDFVHYSEVDAADDPDGVLGRSKACILRALVEQSSKMPLSGAYFARMRQWLQLPYASALAILPIVLPAITALLDPSSPATTQHAVIGLVKNLSIPSDNKVLLGEAAVIEKLFDMGVFSTDKDLLGSVQGGAAGIIKNLCRNNAANALRFTARPLQPILDLIERTDDPALRFECTRALVSVVKSLASAQSSLEPMVPTAAPIAIMFTAATEYPILQSEAVIALALLATYNPSTTLRAQAEGDRREVRENARTLVDLLEPDA